EDIEPNIGFELDQYARATGVHVTISKEAKDRFLHFATSPEGRWTGNFRDLNGAVTRMATLAPGGRISVAVVDDEIARLRAAWRASGTAADGFGLESVLGAERLSALDYFDRVQLAAVLEACRTARTLSEAGRRLFATSRGRKKHTNDADRLRKYLARFGITWSDLTSFL